MHSVFDNRCALPSTKLLCLYVIPLDLTNNNKIENYNVKWGRKLQIHDLSVTDNLTLTAVTRGLKEVNTVGAKNAPLSNGRK
jgi:hypothetical protein